MCIFDERMTGNSLGEDVDFGGRVSRLGRVGVTERASNSILEERACGTPVIVTDVGDVTDCVDDLCAIVAGAGDAGACAEALVEMTRDRVALAQMSSAARARAEAVAWPIVVDARRRVYEATWSLA